MEKTLISNSLHWIVLSISIWVIVFLIVPPRYFKSLWLPSFLTGFVLTYPFNYLAFIFNIWKYPPTTPLVLGVPLFVSVAWYGAMFLFDFFVLTYSRFKLYLVFGATILTGLAFISATLEKHMFIEKWGKVETTVLAVIAYGISIFVLRLFVKNKDLGPNDKPLF
jgi:hypothetical protein